jgi:hypothetical protein
VVMQIEGAGLSGTTSLYRPGEEIKVTQIGPGTVFWTDEERAAAVGKPLMALKGPARLAHLAHDTLSTAARTNKPALARVIYDGARRVVWDRLALHFPRSNAILGCVAVREVA